MPPRKKPRTMTGKYKEDHGDGEQPVRIKHDIATAKHFILSELATERYKGKDTQHRRKSYRDILVAHLLNHVTIDEEDRTVGWSTVHYKPSATGQKFIDAGVIQGERVYGGPADPFTLPNVLNDVLTGTCYRNWDDAKAFHYYVLSHPSVAAKNKRALKKFLEDPVTVMARLAEHYDVDVAAIKELFHRLVMDGGIESWRDEHGVSKEIKDIDLVVEFRDEMRGATQDLLNHVENNKRAELTDYLRSEHEKKKTTEAFRPGPSFKHYLLAEVEWKAREAKRGVFRELGLEHGSLEHDGIKELYSMGNLPDDKMASRLTEAVSNAVGVHIPVVCKYPRILDGDMYDTRAPITTSYVNYDDIPKQGRLLEILNETVELNKKIKKFEEGGKERSAEEIEAIEMDKDRLVELREQEDKLNEPRRAMYEYIYGKLAFGQRVDEVNARNILQAFEHGIFRTGHGLVMYDEEAGLWTLDADGHQRLVLMRSKDIIVGEGSFERLYKDAYKIVSCLAPELDNFETAGVEEQKGHLLFNNGVLDMATFEIKPKDPKYFFLNRINRDFDANMIRHARLINQIYRRLLDKSFTNTEKWNYLLQMLSRALAGHYEDKQFITLLGESNCGKGKLTQLMQHALGGNKGFVGTFNSKVLLISKHDQEAAKEWMWFVDLWNKRIIVANETPPITDTVRKGARTEERVRPFDSNTLKVLTSGGDLISMRKLYKNEVALPSRAFPIIFANDVPGFEPFDGAVQKRANHIEFDRTSSSTITEDTDKEFVADSSIDSWVLQPDVGDAFIAMLCYWYTESLTNRIPKPDFVIREAQKRGTDGRGTLEEWLNEKYKRFPGQIEDLQNGQFTADGEPLFDKDKVGNYYTQFDWLYKDWTSEGNKESKINFGKQLTRLGFPTWTVYLTNTDTGMKRATRCRVGLRKRTADDEDEGDLPVVSMNDA